MNGLVDAIESSVARVLRTQEFKEWSGRVRLGDGDWVALNNSFLLRKDLSLQTQKSSLYLVINVGKEREGQYTVREIAVTRPEKDLNAVFRKIRPQAAQQRTGLEDSVRSQVEYLGRMVTCLIGPIQAEAYQVDVENQRFTALAIDPNIEDEVTVVGHEIKIQKPRAVEQHWQQLQDVLSSHGIPPEELAELAPAFKEAYSSLREMYHEKIRLPREVADLEANDTVLSRIVDSLRGEIERYETEINEFTDSDSESAYHEVLRISYNFSEVLVDVLRLIVGICDLKPVVLWLTCGEQMELLEVFQRQLPWQQVRRKPSLKEYRDAIGGARNHRFHKLLSFSADLVADLEGVTIDARRLTMFTAYKSTRSRNSVNFDFVDREIVELLTTFTRAPEHEVAPQWWERNLKVMKATLELVVAFQRALIGVTRAALRENRQAA